MYEGTVISETPAKHVFKDANTHPREERDMVIRLDEIVRSKEDVEKLGIAAGDFVCYDTKTTFTSSGFLKSRFIDDKACAGIFLTLLTIFKELNIKPKHKTYICFSVHEEIGYGGSTLPRDMKELLVVDMGCIGDDLSCKETNVSICAKDSSGPYDYAMTSRLVELSKEPFKIKMNDSFYLLKLRFKFDKLIYCFSINFIKKEKRGRERSNFSN